MHHDPSDFGLTCLVKKRKNPVFGFKYSILDFSNETLPFKPSTQLKATEQSLIISMELNLKLNWKPYSHSNISCVSHVVLPKSNTAGNKNSC